MHGPPKPGRAKHRRRRVLGRRRGGNDSFARSFGPVNPKSPRVTVRSLVSTSTNLTQVRPNRRWGERRIGHHAARPSKLSLVLEREVATKGERIAVHSQRGQLPEDVPARRSYCRSRQASFWPKEAFSDHLKKGIGREVNGGLARNQVGHGTCAACSRVKKCREPHEVATSQKENATSSASTQHRSDWCLNHRSLRCSAFVSQATPAGGIAEGSNPRIRKF